MKNLVQKYLSIHRTIIYLMMVDVSLQLINSAFTLLLNYLMLDHGFKDYEITSMVGNRYLTVLLCAIPLAVIVKGKRLKPFIVAGALSAPTVALLLIWSIHSHNSELIRTLMAFWGVAFSLVQVLVLPYMLLNGNKEHETESIALFFSAGNLTIIIVGLFSFVLPMLNKLFSTEVLLIIYSMLGFTGAYFARLLPKEENLGTRIPFSNLHSDYDWNLIIQAIIPTFIIAFGAGFTIPFVNLFFKNVHGMGAGDFSFMNSIAFSLVVITAFFIPEVKRRFGYQVAITLVQSFSIVALFVMGATEWFKALPIALPIAVFAFIVRQPLMNMAGPMTSELTLNFVGEKNREMISALNAAIWSGCWFASAKIFSMLREASVEYSNIIFITVFFYIIGVAWYAWLIRTHERRLQE